MCPKFTTEESDCLKNCSHLNPNLHTKQVSDSDFISPKALFKKHAQKKKNQSREQMSRSERTQAQEGNSLSDRTPAPNLLLTCEFFSTWIFFMMTEDDKDTTQPMFLYFTTEAKPVQTLHS